MISQILLPLDHTAISKSGGSDDICTVQPFSPTNDIDLTPIFVSQCAMDRRVEQLGWRVIKEDYEKPFLAANLSFRPLTGS
ncbi:hypothetical protein YC2023_023142 [Brassica napus]